MIEPVPSPVVETVVRFGEWLAACDNRLSCEALSWAVDQGDETLNLSLSRQSIDAPPEVTISLARPRQFVADAGAPPAIIARQLLSDRTRRVALHIDGEPIDVAPGISGAHLVFSAAEQRTLWNRLPPGEALVLSDEKGRVLGRVSLNGLVHAVAAFELAQAQALSPAAVNQPPVDDAHPERVSSAELAPLLSDYGCWAEDDVQTYRLDADHTLALPVLQCEAPAKVEFRAAFVTGPDGLSEAVFREPGTSRLSVRGPLTNVGWDAADRRLSLFLDHAGTADCGISLTYAWDGAILAAVERRELGGCTSFRRTLTTWRADVTVEVGSGQ